MLIRPLLEAHLANSHGFSLRDIVRERGGHASTYSRHVAACEDLTEHPEWSEAIDLLHKHRDKVNPPRLQLTRQDILDTFGVEEQKLLITFQHLTPFIKNPEGRVLMGDMPRGVATFVGSQFPKYTFEKNEGLCLLVLEMIWPSDDGKGQVRRFTGASNVSDHDFWEAPRKLTRSKSKKSQSKFDRSYDSLVRRKFITKEELMTAQEFEQLYIGREAVTKGLWEYLLDRNKGDIHNVLMAICIEQKGLQEYEQEKGWPARSCKVVFRIALQQTRWHLDKPEVPNPLFGTRT